MTTPYTERSQVRAQEACFGAAELFSREVNYSGTFALYTPKAPPVPTIQDRFAHALTFLTHQNWQQFALDCGATIAEDPGDFALYTIAGLCEFIIAELEGLVELGATIVGWIGDYAACLADVGPLDIYDPDQILLSWACRPFHDAAAALIAIRQFAEEILAMGTAGLMELAQEVYPLAIQSLQAMLEDGLQWLGDQAPAFEAWLRETAHDATALGRAVGTIVGMLLLELGTAGVARALKTARWVSRLPGLPRVVDAVTDSADLTRSAPTVLDAGTAGLASPDLAAAEPASGFPAAGPTPPGARSMTYTLGARSITVTGISRRGLLDDLVDVMFVTLRTHGKRFSKNLTEKKVQILKKHVPAEALKKFSRARGLMALDLKVGFRRHKGAVARYGTQVGEVEDFNRRTLAFHYAEAATTDENLDYFNLLARKDAILPNVFESNHIFEQRIFLARKRVWKSDMEKLGWKGINDMEAVLMTADEHTGSVGKMLERYGMTPSEIREVQPPPSITTTLKRHIKLREELDSTPGPEVLVVEPDTPFMDVLRKYAEVYKTHSPDLWDQSLVHQFNAWREKLGLSAPVFTPNVPPAPVP